MLRTGRIFPPMRASLANAAWSFFFASALFVHLLEASSSASSSASAPAPVPAEEAELGLSSSLLAEDAECERSQSANRDRGAGGGLFLVDDEVEASSDCALSALQLRKARGELQIAQPRSMWELDPSLAGQAWPPLCDALLVAAGCSILSPEGSGAWTNANDLADGLGATDESTSNFLKSIGLAAATEANVDINCTDLCFHVIDSIGPEYLPPRSEVACRLDQHGLAICDIDLSNQSVEAITFDGSPTNFHEGHNIAYVTPAPKGTVEEEDVEDFTPIDVAVKEAQTLVANLFRVYPIVDISIAFGHEDMLEEPDDPLAAQVPGASSRDRSNTNSSISSISSTTGKDLQNSHAFQHRPALRASGGRHHQRRQLPHWVAEVQRTSVKAQAYVSFALRRAPLEQAKLMTWFGKDNNNTRHRVMAVLRSVSRMLANVEYRRGRHCDPDTYAYVYPGDNHGPERGTKNARGQYLLYLCNLYFHSAEAEQIEVLTHEGSHHATAFTDDVCLGRIDHQGNCHGTEVYGRRLCKKVAVEHPRSARNNADSFCYYINDLNGSE